MSPSYTVVVGGGGGGGLLVVVGEGSQRGLWWEGWLEVDVGGCGWMWVDWLDNCFRFEKGRIEGRNLGKKKKRREGEERQEKRKTTKKQQKNNKKKNQ